MCPCWVFHHRDGIMWMLNPLVSKDEPFGFCFYDVNTNFFFFTELVT